MPAVAPRRLPPAKVRLVQVARRQLGLSEEDFRSVLGLYGGVSSTLDLDQGGFTAVLAQLTRLGFRSTSPRRPMPARAGMASPGQYGLIRYLWAECTAGEGTEASLGKWLERQFGVSSLRFVTAEAAPKVIGGLKAMKTNLDRAAARSGTSPAR